MSRVFHFPTLKLANRIFYAMAGISLFLVIFITPPLMRHLDGISVLGGYLFGIVELWFVRFALILFPVFFVVMAVLTRRLDKELYRYVQTLDPEQAKQP